MTVEAGDGLAILASASGKTAANKTSSGERGEKI